MFDKRVLPLLRNKNMVILVMMGGLEAGVNVGWSGLIPQILDDQNYSKSYIG